MQPPKFAGGISYRKSDSEKPATFKREACRRAGCKYDATCMPRLYIPRHKMSINARADDVSALMGIALCERHFREVQKSPGLFLHRQEVRDSIATEFRKRNAMPDFDRAVIGRIPLYDPDYARIKKLEERVRRAGVHAKR